MTSSIARFAWSYSWREQILLLTLTLISFPFVYASLEIPKIIINQAINGSEFPVEILGIAFDQIPFLFLLCGVFLALVLIINALKWFINVGIGMAGERLLRRLRFTLFEQVMRFPSGRLRATRPGETIQSIMGELEPLGGFMGEVLVTPIFQGGLLAVYVTFIFVQDVWLGLAAIALYPFQAFIVPILQARIIRLNRERVANARLVADQIGESIRSAPEIRANATTRWHFSQISGRLFRATQIRQDIFKRKFTIKFVNNLLNQLTPFFFYSAGGYFVIKGQLDFGSLVAILAAYKDLAGPWKALLGFVQRLSDFGARYRFVMQSFLEENPVSEEKLHAPAAVVPSGSLALHGVRIGTEDEARRIADLTVRPGETIAFDLADPGTRETLMAVLSGQQPPLSGRLAIGGQDLESLSFDQLGAALVRVSASPAMIRGTLRANTLYGLFQNTPPIPDTPDGDNRERLREALATGNPATDPDADWVDYARAGVATPEELDARLMAYAETFGLSETLYAVALDRVLPREQAEEWHDRLLSIRDLIAEHAADFEDLVEPWSHERYNTNGTVLANLLFALPIDPAEGPGGHLDNPEVRRILAKSGGDLVLTELGWRIGGALANLVAAIDSASPIFDRFAAFGRTEIKEAARIATENAARGWQGLGARDRQTLQAIAANFVTVRDQLDVLDDDLRERILSVRARALGLVRGDAAFVPLDSGRLNPSRTVAENILNARRRFDRRSSWNRLNRQIETALKDRGLWHDLIRIGFQAQAGTVDLPASALRRLSLIRAVLKRPAFVVLDNVADGATEADLALRNAVRAALPEAGILFAPHAGAAGSGADRVVRIE